MTVPLRASFRTDELAPLDRWLRAGNTLLVMAAISDNPDWAAFRGTYAAGDISLLTGLEFETVRAREDRLEKRARPAATDPPQPRESGDFRSFAEPQQTAVVPNRPHAYFDGVQELVALSGLQACSVGSEGSVSGIRAGARSRPRAWRRRVWTRPLGSGRIIVSGYGSLFTNRALGLGDNARLLANIVGTNVSADGAVLFDDVHQGSARPTIPRSSTAIRGSTSPSPCSRRCGSSGCSARRACACRQFVVRRRAKRS